MANLFIFGLGYTAKRIAAAMQERGWSVEATGSAGSVDFDDRDAVRELATVWDPAIPPAKNPAYVQRVKELERDLEARLTTALMTKDDDAA